MMNLSEFIVRRLVNVGVRTVFGVPGDFVMHFMDYLNASKDVSFVPCRNELNATYMADGYARTSVGGVGCVCVTTGVGAMSAMNGIALAYAEHVPLIIISGTPFIQDTEKAKSGRILLHHTTGTSTSMTWEATVFEPVTCAQVTLSLSPFENCNSIDAALLRCVTERRPILIQIPVDLVHMPLPESVVPTHLLYDRDFRAEVRAEKTKICPCDQVERAVQWIVKRVMDSKGNGIGRQGLQHGETGGVVAISGLEFQRYYNPDDQIRRDLANFFSSTQIPFATGLMGRGVLSEDDPLYVGRFNGEAADSGPIAEFVRGAGLVLVLGAQFVDVDMSEFEEDEKWIWIGGGCVRCGGEVKFERVGIARLVERLGQVLPQEMKKGGDRLSQALRDAIKKWAMPAPQQQPPPKTGERRDKRTEGKQKKFIKADDAMMTILNHIPKNSILSLDVGDVFFRLEGLQLPHGCQFMSNTFYKAIGHSLPAGIGAAFAERDRMEWVERGRRRWTREWTKDWGREMGKERQRREKLQHRELMKGKEGEGRERREGREGREDEEQRGPSPFADFFASLQSSIASPTLPPSPLTPVTPFAQTSPAAPVPSVATPSTSTSTATTVSISSAARAPSYPPSSAICLSHSTHLHPVIILIGDGAMQMTVQELSTLVEYGLKATVVVWRNAEYGIEKVLHPEGVGYNDIIPWRWDMLAGVMGGGLEEEEEEGEEKEKEKGLGPAEPLQSHRVRSVDKLEAAMDSIKAPGQGPVLIEVVLNKGDMDRRLTIWGQAIHDKMEAQQKIITDLVIRRSTIACHIRRPSPTTPPPTPISTPSPSPSPSTTPSPATSTPHSSPASLTPSLSPQPSLPHPPLPHPPQQVEKKGPEGVPVPPEPGTEARGIF